MLTEEQFKNIVGENGILDSDDPAEIRKAKEAYALGLAQSGELDAKVKTKNQHVTDIKSAVDSAVDTVGHGLPYVRIKNVDAAINKAQEDLYRNKVGVAPTSPRNDSFINWDFFKSTKNT